MVYSIKKKELNPLMFALIFNIILGVTWFICLVWAYYEYNECRKLKKKKIEEKKTNDRAS